MNEDQNNNDTLNTPVQPVEDPPLEREDTTVRRSPFNLSPTYVTYMFMAANIIVWLLMELGGGSTSIATLIKFGAKYNPHIVQGEYYRLFTAMFLHIGIMHLAFNTYALLNLGRACERIFGRLKFVYIYIISGIIASIASFGFSSAISAGASGAIFGLMGSLLYFFKTHPKVFLRVFDKSIFFVLGLNLIYGFTQANIDNYAHIGGLIGGFFAAASVGLLIDRKINFKKIIASIIVIILVAGGLFGALKYGVYGWYNDFSKAYNLIEAEDYQGAAQILTQLEKSYPSQLEIKFYLGYIYEKTGDYNKSIEYFKRVLEIDPGNTSSYFNLAIIYYTLEQDENAVYYLEQLLIWEPDHQEAKNFINIINNNN